MSIAGLPMAISWWTVTHQFQTCSCSGPLTTPITRASSWVHTNTVDPYLRLTMQNTRPAACVTGTVPAAIAAIV